MKLFSFKKKKLAPLRAEEAKRVREDGVLRARRPALAPREENAAVVSKGTGATAEFSDRTAKILIRPHVTEKAARVSETSRAYVFRIVPSATKQQVKEAVRRMYKVAPVSVHIVPIRRKKVVSRGKKGMTAGGKKAYVYLKGGETIEFV